MGQQADAIAHTRVFITYSHQAAGHRLAAIELAQKLRGMGVDAQVDEFVNGTPDQGWPKWMQDQIEHSDFVAVIASPEYEAAMKGKAPPETGKGVAFETAAILSLFLASGSRTSRFVPLFTDSKHRQHLPSVLQGHTAYHVEDDYEAFYRFVTGQPIVTPMPLGNAVRLSDVAKNAAAAKPVNPINGPHNLIDLTTEVPTKGAANKTAPVDDGVGGRGNASTLREQVRAELVALAGELDELLVKFAARGGPESAVRMLEIAESLGCITTWGVATPIDNEGLYLRMRGYWHEDLDGESSGVEVAVLGIDSTALNVCVRWSAGSEEAFASCMARVAKSLVRVGRFPGLERFDPDQVVRHLAWSIKLAAQNEAGGRRKCARSSGQYPLPAVGHYNRWTGVHATQLPHRSEPSNGGFVGCAPQAKELDRYRRLSIVADVCAWISPSRSAAIPVVVKLTRELWKCF